MLGHRIIACLTFSGAAKLFCKAAEHFSLTASVCVRFQFLCFLISSLLQTVFFKIALLMGAKWYLIAGLIYIPLMINMEHLFMCFLSIVCLLWRNVCWSFAHLKIGFFFWVVRISTSRTRLKFFPHDLKICSPILWIVFSFDVLWSTEVFNFDNLI